MDQSSFQKQPGLTRYRSAPSSYFSSLLSSGGGCAYARDDFYQLQNARASTADIEQVFATFVATIGNPHSNSLDKNDFVVPKQENIFISSVKQEPEILQNPASVDNSFTFMTSTNNMGGASSNLTRYNSSPAGFNIENEYGGTSKRLKTQVGGKPPTPPRLMPPILEIGDKGILEESSNTNNEDFPELSWKDSHILSDDFLEAPEDNESEPFSNNRAPNPLTHHLSMPTSSMEKLLPLNVRAKRGCATHPRSIAERVRRTRISERMRKLQQLVPNMDKQTNTADMLDFAVDYIKHLEKQVKLLEERRAKCTCTFKQDERN